MLQMIGKLDLPECLLPLPPCIFFELKQHNIAPLSWGVASTAITKLYHHEMANQIPELLYCAGHWKADWIASKIYSSWYGTHGAKGVKIEDGEVGTVVPKPRKCHCSGTTSAEKNGKRQKPEEMANQQRYVVVYHPPPPCPDFPFETAFPIITYQLKMYHSPSH